jgi:hypothetical protein
LGWTGTLTLLISTSQLAGITGKSTTLGFIFILNFFAYAIPQGNLGSKPL